MNHLKLLKLVAIHNCYKWKSGINKTYIWKIGDNIMLTPYLWKIGDNAMPTNCRWRRCRWPGLTFIIVDEGGAALIWSLGSLSSHSFNYTPIDNSTYMWKIGDNIMLTPYLWKIRDNIMSTILHSIITKGKYKI